MPRKDADAAPAVVAVSANPPPVAKTAPRRRWLRRLIFGAGVTVVSGMVAFALAYWNHNVARLTDAEFAAALDQAIERGRAWVRQHRDLSAMQYNNPPMHFLLHDMDRMCPDPVFAARVREYLNRSTFENSWKHLIDPQRPVLAAELNAALPDTPFDYRWLTYALDPQHIKLAPDELAGMFDGERWHGLVLAHQLWALCHMRRLAPDPRVSAGLLSRLCERIAAEHARDLVVTKLHSERVGFILMAGHPARINRRWVERLIANQRADGGWNDRLYACTLPTQFRDGPSDEHNTLVTLWALHEARYRYPAQFGWSTAP
jgi:hypothetical protein